MIFVTGIQIAYFLQKKLFEHFLEVFEDVMRDCKYSPKLVDPPIRVSTHTRIYIYNNFVIKSLSLSLSFPLS